MEIRQQLMASSIFILLEQVIGYVKLKVVTFGCPPPKYFLKHLKNCHKICVLPDHQIQKNDSFCGSYCLYIIYSTKMIGIDFISAVLNLHYKMVQ